MASSNRLLHYVLISLAGISIGAALQKCIHRDYGYGGHVCVCNSTYCDFSSPLPQVLPRHFYLYTSSKVGLRFDITRKNLGTKWKSTNVSFTVNPDIQYQAVMGFGGAFTDAAGINIASLSEDAQAKLLEGYFGPSGIGYTLARIPIAGSDFSTRKYTYADNKETHLSQFQLTDEDHQYKIPFVKKATILSNNSLRLLAAAWTAPPWMKTNEDYSGLGFLREEFYELWSLYHIKFLKEYEKHGVRIWALSTGHEPLNGAIPFYPSNSMGWTPIAQKKWVSQHLGPMLKLSKFNDTLLIALDGQRFQLPWWISIMFHKKEAAQYISGIGVHWYWDHIAPTILLDKTHDAYPDKFILSTEACFTKQLWESNVVHLGSWERGEQYAENIIDDMNHWVGGWIDWNLALDPSGGPNWAENVVDAAVIVNSTADEFYKQPMFYALGHFSKFVPVGSRRLALTGGTAGVKGVAFITPQDLIVIIVLNKKNTEKSIQISGAPRGIANFITPPKSIVTFICRNKKLPAVKILDEDV